MQVFGTIMELALQNNLGCKPHHATLINNLKHNLHLISKANI